MHATLMSYILDQLLYNVMAQLKLKCTVYSGEVL
jgi:hypothetical protein